MNQKYIDFVPTKKTPPQAEVSSPARPSSVRKPHPPQPSPSVKPRPKASAKASSRPVPPKAPSTQVSQQAKSHAKSTFSIKNEPALGVIEDFHPKFVSSEVEKRPLSRSHFTTSKSEIAELKARDIKKTARKTPAGNTTNRASANTTNPDNSQSLQIPKSPFIAKAKVAKRPLSKNSYSKPVQPTKEPATGPVTIIAKPEEKESKGGMAIAIILTIILGAVAGTIAFLIMPK